MPRPSPTCYSATSLSLGGLPTWVWSAPPWLQEAGAWGEGHGGAPWTRLLQETCPVPSASGLRQPHCMEEGDTAWPILGNPPNPLGSGHFPTVSPTGNRKSAGRWPKPQKLCWNLAGCCRCWAVARVPSYEAAPGSSGRPLPVFAVAQHSRCPLCSHCVVSAWCLLLCPSVKPAAWHQAGAQWTLWEMGAEAELLRRPSGQGRGSPGGRPGGRGRALPPLLSLSAQWHPWSHWLCFLALLSGPLIKGQTFALQLPPAWATPCTEAPGLGFRIPPVMSVPCQRGGSAEAGSCSLGSFPGHRRQRPPCPPCVGAGWAVGGLTLPAVLPAL